MRKRKSSSLLTLGQTNSGRYVNLILIILTIFIALIRRKNVDTAVQGSAVQNIATYTFDNLEGSSADLLALATLLKSHDVTAEVTISSRKPASKAIAEITTYFDQIGIPFDAYKVIGKTEQRDEIRVEVYRMGQLTI